MAGPEHHPELNGPVSVDELAGFGPFFAVSEHVSPDASWQPMTDLVDDPKVLESRVDRVRESLSANGGGIEVDSRVAASVAHLGLVARLLAPMIGVAALGRPVSWSLTDLAWQDRLGGPYPLSVVARPVGGVRAHEALTEAFIPFGVSRKVLWGNVGSAINSAVMQISRVRPDLFDAARTAADETLADPRIDGGARRSGPGFRRASCCLIYRVSGDRRACCGDCVLTR